MSDAAAQSADSPNPGDLHSFIRKIYLDGFALGEDDRRHEITWSLAPARGEFVYRMCRQSGAHSTLEIGFAPGVSTLCILAALLDSGSDATPHLAMDPFQGGERFRNAGLRTLRDAGVAECVEFLPEASETLSPRLVAGRRQFDFILIDGDHSFDHTLVDIFFAHRLLKPGGTMVIDNIDMPPVYLANRYLLNYYRCDLIDEAWGSHSDPDQTWRGIAVPSRGSASGPRVWIRAYREPLSEPQDQSFWGASFDDFMRFWVDDFHDPELMESDQRRTLNVDAMRALTAGQMRLARRYLIASLARDSPGGQDLSSSRANFSAAPDRGAPRKIILHRQTFGMKNRYVPLAIAILLVSAMAQAAKAADLPDSITLPIKVIDNRAFIEVSISGQGPFHFVIDSGGSSIVSTSLAKRLGLKSYGPFQGKGVGEKPIAAAHCNLSDLEIGDLHFPDQKIVTTDLDDIKNAIGFEALDGILGYELFAAWVVAIDFDKRTATLTRPSAYTCPSNAVVLPIRIIERLPVVTGSIAGLPATFSLDTGDRWWLTLHTPFVAAHHMIEKYRPSIRALTGWGGGGPVPAYVTRVEGLTLGSLDLGAPITRFPLTHSGAFTRADISGNIGAGILRHMKITFDYSAGRVIFENISSIDGSYDRSGMWLSQSGDNFEIIWAVENGPAAQAEIHKGDLVVSVNGKSTREWFLPDLRDELCDPRIDSMTMVVESHGRLTNHTIHLRTLVD